MIIRRFTLLLTVSWVLLLSAQGSELIISRHLDDKKSVELKVEGHFSGPAPYGYYPVRVTLVNQRDSKVKIDFSHKSNGGYYYYRRREASVLSNRLSIEVDANQTFEKDILLPLFRSKGGEARIEFEFAFEGSKHSSSVEHSTNENFQAALMSLELYEKHCVNLEQALSSSHSFRGGNVRFASVMSSTLFPKQWQAYLGFERIIISDLEWLRLTAEERSAITHWTRLGGYLQIYCEQATSNIQSLRLPRDLLKLTKDSDLRAGYFETVTSRPGSHPAFTKNYGPKAQSRRNSWGLSMGIVELYHRELEPKALLLETQVTNNKSASSDSNKNDFTLVENYGADLFSSTTLIWLLVVFAIVVGPLNFFWFARAGRRHRILITIPIITFSTCILLVALILIGDGIGGKGHRVSHVEIVHEGNQHHAYIQQEQLVKTGLILSSRFEMSDVAVLHPVALSKDNQWNKVHENSKERYIQSQNGSSYEYSGDWFQSRAQLAHSIEAVLPQRGKFSLKSNTDMIVESTFDFTVATIFYHDENGQWWRGDDVERGGSCDLKRSELTNLEEILEDVSLDEYTLERIRILAQRKGHFVALTSEYPMLESHSAIDWTNHNSILTGKLH